MYSLPKCNSEIRQNFTHWISWNFRLTVWDLQMSLEPLLTMSILMFWLKIGRKSHSYFKASGTEPRTTNCWVQPRHFCRLWEGKKKVSVWDRDSDTMTRWVNAHNLQLSSLKMKRKTKKMLVELKICRAITAAGKKREWPDLVLLPQQSHEAVVLLAAAGGVRRAAGASQRVVVLTDGGAGDLSGWTKASVKKVSGLFFLLEINFKTHRAHNQQHIFCQTPFINIK